MPSPPKHLRNATPHDMPATTIEWDPPVYTGGNETSIWKYRIRIPETNYSEEKSGTELSHTLRANSINGSFNTLYKVDVTAINTCGNESIPASIVISIEANG